LREEGVIFTERHEEAAIYREPVRQGCSYTSCNPSIFPAHIERKTSHDMQIANKLDIHQATFYDLLNIKQIINISYIEELHFYGTPESLRKETTLTV
jgi:hypothetical protein